MSHVAPLGLFMLSLLVCNPLQAWEFYGDKDRLYVAGGYYAHFSNEEDYEGPPILASLEIIKPDHYLYGLALFNNSFGQFAQYLYFGKEFKLNSLYEGLRSKVSAGAIFGYRGDYEDNLLLNEELGFAPAIIPGIGYQRSRWGMDLYLLGDEALLFSIGYEF